MRMHSSLETVDHRPWPLPQQKWKWRQSWLDLAFIHYRVLPEDLRDLLPDGIQLQEFDGSAWIGIVPFRMANVTRRSLPSVPYLSAFPELNLRTYVEVNGKPGVWFLSLDAASLPFVMAARRLYRLPYFFARIRAKQTEGWINFSSVRSGGVVRFEAKYRPVGEVFYATEGTFEHWATERYCLYSSPRDGEMTRVEVHHAPWPLQEAELVVEKNNLMSARGISAVEGEPVCHFSSGVHVISFGGEAIARGRELQVKDN